MEKSVVRESSVYRPTADILPLHQENAVLYAMVMLYYLNIQWSFNK